MEHFAILAPPFPSHVSALEALACQLIDRGHAVTWIHQSDVQAFVSDRRIGFHAVGGQTHPAGSLAKVLQRAASPGGLAGIRRVITDIAASTKMLCKEAPDVLRDLKITAVIADQMEAAGGLVAAGLRLPFVSVACALPVNREAAIPLPVMPWAYAISSRALELNRTSSRIYDWLMKPHAEVILGYSKVFGLASRQTLSECLSPLLQISQTTAEFDFPRKCALEKFYHVGPLRGQRLSNHRFDFSVEPSRPFVFASLGTLQGWRMKIFMRIARACKAANLQLLIAHCKHLDTAQEQSLTAAGATWVTGFTDQQEAVNKASVVVTHGGLNTVLDALAAGTPVLVLPIAFDQPGVAARVVHAGCGLSLNARWASSSAIGKALMRLINEPPFAHHALQIGHSVARAGGVPEASRLVLAAVKRAPGSGMNTLHPEPTPQQEERIAYAA